VSPPTIRTTSGCTCGSCPRAAASRGDRLRLRRAGQRINVPSWSPDGRMLAFVSNSA
jgi:hypothetical protein